jgi:putative DNA primase/helicase
MSHEIAELEPELRAIANGEPPGFRPTDAGNAERLVADHGADLRHVAGIGWLVWDGRRWQRDCDGEVVRRARRMARSIYAEAAGGATESERKQLAAWAAKSESEPRLRAAIALAQYDPAIVLRPGDLDADPFLLNVENGTIELRTGELHEHRRADLLTKLAPVAFRPDADMGEWLRFLARVTDCDPELEAFLRRAVGYTLTGDASEEVLLFAHGPAATGKTTFLDALRATLGDYGATADFETFLARRGESGIRSDVARLVGARMVVGVEVDEGKRLAEGLLKQLTGGDTVTARFMYRDFFEFRPQFKLWLAANHRPRVSAEDEAIWRRIVQVPFTEVIPEPEQDPEVKRRLREDPDSRAGILRWAVQGCLDWQGDGLKVPARVREYTAEYRAENDPIAEWLETCCVVRQDASATASELRTSYAAWAEHNGERPVSPQRLAAAFRARGFERERDRNERRWLGVGLNGDAVTQVTPDLEKSL